MGTWHELISRWGQDEVALTGTSRARCAPRQRASSPSPPAAQRHSGIALYCVGARCVCAQSLRRALVRAARWSAPRRAAPRAFPSTHSVSVSWPRPRLTAAASAGAPRCLRTHRTGPPTRARSTRRRCGLRSSAHPSSRPTPSRDCDCARPRHGLGVKAPQALLTVGLSRASADYI